MNKKIYWIIGIIGAGIAFYLYSKSKQSSTTSANSGNGIIPNSTSGTLGERNNNPGNIRYNPANNWQGQVGQNSGFCVFSSMEYGIRAMIVLLKNYIAQGYDTIPEIVSRYAPSSENNTQNYIDYILSETGISPSVKISGDNLFILISVMCYYESKLTFSSDYIKSVKEKFGV